jgi:hypothetical protein
VQSIMIQEHSRTSPSPSPAAAYLPSSLCTQWMHRYRCRSPAEPVDGSRKSEHNKAGFQRSAGNVPNDDAALKRRDERARRANVLAHILPNTWALPSYSSCHQKSFTQISPAKQHCKASSPLYVPNPPPPPIPSASLRFTYFLIIRPSIGSFNAERLQLRAFIHCLGRNWQIFPTLPSRRPSRYNVVDLLRWAMS